MEILKHHLRRDWTISRRYSVANIQHGSASIDEIQDLVGIIATRAAQPAIQHQTRWALARSSVMVFKEIVTERGHRPFQRSTATKNHPVLVLHVPRRCLNWFPLLFEIVQESLCRRAHTIGNPKEPFH